MRPTDPKALKRKTRPIADRKIGAAARRPTKAVVLEPVLGKESSRSTGTGERRKPPLRSPEARLEEALGLARAIRSRRARARLVPLRRPRPATLFGSGKVDELEGLIRAEDADLVIVDRPLTPSAAAQSGEGVGRQGARPHRAHPRDLRRARAHAGRARCRSSLPTRSIRRAGWCVPGPTLSASAAASASWAAPAKRRSRPTGA